MLIDVVRQLGAEVDERWAREDYALDAFASIAADAMERFSLHDLFDLAEFADWLTVTEDLPEQLHATNKFGDPRITVWRSSRFLVDMYFWTTPETTRSMIMALPARSPTYWARVCIASIGWRRSTNPNPG
jgi:hypothetical protein